MRIILYTGKGGVGKTSIAALSALEIANKGKKVIVVSTDQAHSLSDSFDVEIKNEPTTIAPNLDAMEIDVVKESEDAWGNLKDYMKELLTIRVSEGIEADELLVFPGLEELFSLFKILDIYEHMDYDVLIVDCAPTGETLSLLKFPEMFGAVIEKALPVKRKMVKYAGPVVSKMMKVPMPKDNVFDDLIRLLDKLERLQTIMLNKDVVSLRIVTTSEKVVVKETKRNFTWLQLYDYNVDAIIINKVYPEEALEGYFNKWVLLQEEGIEELNRSFMDIPIFQLMLQKSEIKTIPVLSSIDHLYKGKDPSEVLAKARIFKINREGDHQIMEISLPFAQKSEMDLSQVEGEIHISIMNEKRCITLPDQLKGMLVCGAKHEEGILRIDFEPS